MTQNIVPNYIDMGFADKMGPQLRSYIENQLIDDLKNYISISNILKFDWSESCIEGHCMSYLDGVFENFSGVSVFDINDKIVAHGWINFILKKDFPIVYWDNLSVLVDGKWEDKKSFGLPDYLKN